MVSGAEIEQYLWNNPFWALIVGLFIFNGISILIWKFLGWLIKLLFRKNTQREKVSHPIESPLFNRLEKNLTSTQDPVEKSKTTPQEEISQILFHGPEVSSPSPLVPVEINKDGYIDYTKK